MDEREYLKWKNPWHKYCACGNRIKDEKEVVCDECK